MFRNLLIQIVISLLSFSLMAQSDSDNPDYSNLQFWSAHPDKEHPAKEIPKAKKDEVNESFDIDVFYIHPTTYTSKNPESLNGNLADSKLNENTDNSAVKYQASLFNQVGNVYAP